MSVASENFAGPASAFYTNLCAVQEATQLLRSVINSDNWFRIQSVDKSSQQILWPHPILRLQGDRGYPLVRV